MSVPALIAGYPAGLTEMQTDGASPHILIATTSDGLVPRMPAVSPDGRRLAYVLGPSVGTQAEDSGADLWVATRAGKDRRKLLSHPSSNHTFRAVRWEDDAHLLVVVDVPATCDGCNPETTTTQRLERVDAATGETETIRDGVIEFGLSADRRSVAFPVPESDTAESLRSADLASTSATQVLVPVSQRFAQIASPRYSPDSRQIAFAAAQPRSVRSSARLVSFPTDPIAPGPLDDGLPADVWLMDADGSHLRQLAALRDVGLVLEWDPDGQTIYALGAVALYRVDVATGVDTRIGTGSASASLAYAPARSP